MLQQMGGPLRALCQCMGVALLCRRVLCIEMTTSAKGPLNRDFLTLDMPFLTHNPTPDQCFLSWGQTFPGL